MKFVGVIFLCMVVCIVGQVGNLDLTDFIGRYGLTYGSPTPSPPTNASPGFAYGNFAQFGNATGDDASTVGYAFVTTDVNNDSADVRLGSDLRSRFSEQGSSSLGVRGQGSSRFGNNFAGFNILASDTRTSTQNDSTTLSSIISDAVALTRPGFSATNVSVCIGTQCPR